MVLYFDYRTDISRDNGLKFGLLIQCNPINYIMMKSCKTFENNTSEFRLGLLLELFYILTNFTKMYSASP